MRQITSYKDFLNERLEGKLSFIKGKPINLIKTKISVGKWNPSTGQMDKTRTEEEIDGIIGDIGVDYDGIEFPGFILLDSGGKRRGLVMYDAKKDEFIEGESSFYYTYTGKTDADNRTLELVKNNMI